MPKFPNLTDEERRAIEARRGELPTGPVEDPENPAWTEEDLARAVPAEQLPDEILGHFPKTQKRLGGRPKSKTPKRLVTLRIAPDILEHFQAGGPGWQVRMEEALRRAKDAGGGQA